LVKAIEDKIDNGMSFEELSVKLDISMFQLNKLLDRIDGPFYLLDAIKIANFCGIRIATLFNE
jgi:hypothetical protein